MNQTNQVNSDKQTKEKEPQNEERLYPTDLAEQISRIVSQQLREFMRQFQQKC